MESVRRIALIICMAVAVMFSQVACIGTPDVEEDEDVAELQQELVIRNALTQNALTQNALTQNALTQNALTQNALTQNALTQNTLTQDALRDPLARELLQFLVGCALPVGAEVSIEVEGETYTYEGEVGLAPRWGEEGGSCNEKCQEWVSGCLLSRVNHNGEHIPISIRGKNHALDSTLRERLRYSHREATYFGNVFVTPQHRFACLSPGETELPRVCGPSIEDCVVTVTGSCDDVCGRPRRDGSFPNCRAELDDEHSFRGGHPITPVHTELFKGSVTVFLR
jgi:hypothetical protein